MRVRGALLVGAVAAATLGTFPAMAADWADILSAEPPVWEVAGWELRLSGFVTASAFDAHEGGAFDDTDVTGQARVNLRVQRMFDSGLTIGARSVVLAYHDALSDDRYGNDIFEKLYLFVQTAFGTVEVGQQDGAGARLGVTGPKVDDHVSLDDPDTAFFVDPSTGRRFDSFFRPHSAAATSSNAGKFNFIATRLLGVQLGLSLTPQAVKAPFPFGGNPPDGPTQNFIWEAALSYTGFVTDDLGITASAAYSQGTLDHTAPGLDDLHDWAVGAEAAYSLSEVKFTVGGAYRVSNAYGFNAGLVFDNSETQLAHASGLIEWNDWRLGAEYSHGEIDGPTALPDYTMRAYQVAAGYRVNDNIQLTAGWQWYDYRRDLGLFFDGRPMIDMNAAFLTLGYTL